MPIRALRDIGHRIAKKHSLYAEHENYDQFIKDLTAEEKMVCLLANLVDTAPDWLYAIHKNTLGSKKHLGAISNTLNAKLNEKPTHPVADGLLAVFRCGDPSKKVTEMDRSDLSFRANRILNESGIEYVHQVTRDRLENIPGCGDATIRELLTWARNWSNY